ncbi:hypothetical protein PENTCL1PPCAC_473, partial [Pristionchus entomophagus]
LVDASRREGGRLLIDPRSASDDVHEALPSVLDRLEHFRIRLLNLTIYRNPLGLFSFSSVFTSLFRLLSTRVRTGVLAPDFLARVDLSILRTLRDLLDTAFGVESPFFFVFLFTEA